MALSKRNGLKVDILSQAIVENIVGGIDTCGQDEHQRGIEDTVIEQLFNGHYMGLLVIFSQFSLNVLRNVLH